MDSLGHLADNLPRGHNSSTASLAAAEAELQSTFRNSALAITHLLKASQKTSKKAWQAGFSTALADVLEYLQHNLDLPEQNSQASEANAITQVIDYIEARQEAVRLQGLEADGEEEQEQVQQRAQASRAHSLNPSAQHPQNLRHQHHLYQSAPQPVASTSAAHLPHDTKAQAGQRPGSSLRRHSRSNSRSTSPVPGSSTERPASAGISSPGRAASRGVSRLEDDIPSSSLPNSPDYRLSDTTAPRPSSSAGRLFDFSNPPSSSTSATVDTSASASAAGVVSPLTRLQARREREHRDRHHHHGHGHERGPRSRHGHRSSGAGMEAGPSTAGMKRRWTASLLPDWSEGNSGGMTAEHCIELDGQGSPSEGTGTVAEDEDDEEIDEAEGIEPEERARSEAASTEDADVPKQDGQGQAAGAGAGAGMGMDMDRGDTYRTDGNTRPTKRIVRR